MKLLHLANFHSTNIGNGALIYGAERVLREDLGPTVEFVPAAWDDYTFEKRPFDSDFVDLVNGHDGLLVGGAIIFHSRPYLRAAGMRLNLDVALLKAIKKPIIFYGSSYGVWPHQRYLYKDRLLEALGHLLESPNVYLGVRNDGTKEWLEKMIGTKHPSIREVPDPGLFVPTKDSEHPEIDPDRPNIIVALNNEDEVHRFGGGLQRTLWRSGNRVFSDRALTRLCSATGRIRARRGLVVQQIGSAIGRAAEEHDANIILVPHFFDDYGITHDLHGKLPLIRRYQNTVSTGINRVSDTERFYDMYRNADVAVSMRIHSMSPSIGLRTPLVPVSTQARMTDFLSTIGLSDLSVSPGANLETNLYDALQRTLNDGQSIRSRLDSVVQAQRSLIETCNHDIEKMFDA